MTKKGDQPTVDHIAAKDWRTRMTISVPEYARIVGIGRNTAYEAARQGDVTTIRVRGRVLVCVPALLRQLDGAGH